MITEWRSAVVEIAGRPIRMRVRLMTRRSRRRFLNDWRDMQRAVHRSLRRRADAGRDEWRPTPEDESDVVDAVEFWRNTITRFVRVDAGELTLDGVAIRNGAELERAIRDDRHALAATLHVIVQANDLEPEWRKQLDAIVDADRLRSTIDDPLEVNRVYRKAT